MVALPLEELEQIAGHYLTENSQGPDRPPPLHYVRGHRTRLPVPVPIRVPLPNIFMVINPKLGQMSESFISTTSPLPPHPSPQLEPQRKWRESLLENREKDEFATPPVAPHGKIQLLLLPVPAPIQNVLTTPQPQLPKRAEHIMFRLAPTQDLESEKVPLTPVDRGRQIAAT